MSNAGKSMLVTALCRIFKQDGYRVAPFKSQNMALNSFVTADGLEMGRAQAAQAEAAGVLPDVRMNPVLLKPVHDSGSQVIVHGEVMRTVSARDYYEIKAALKPEVMKAYSSLAGEYDIIVIEGAGSAAELNLSKDDFVNMGLAKMVNAPVLLVGDIDRGGVFAQLFGTVKLLPEDERNLIKGLIVNKFRGDMALFDDGVRLIEDICKKPVLGVVPFLDVDIDDEDSLSDRLGVRDQNKNIAVIRLPHISNFTDFNALNARYVSSPGELGEPGLLIIPGTMNTTSDLIWLYEKGFEMPIKSLFERQIPIVGICGGYQILGERLFEDGKEYRGLGLLPVVTEFKPTKKRSQLSGEFLKVIGKLSRLSGKKVSGYEIHMGQSRLNDGAKPLLILDDGTYDGCQQGNVYGTYLHGIFENDLFYKERQYDRLAQGVRSAINMDLVYKELLGRF
jgi:adenosylcobyric acid synthase